MTLMALISVIIPVFNAGRYLRPAIQSILTQSLGDFELLIYDDGSTDGSQNVLREFARSDSRVKLHGGAHQGYSKWLNQGVADSLGVYIARMDADDIASADRFALQVNFLHDHPGVAAVGGQVIAVDPDGDPLFPLNLPLTHEEIDEAHMAGRSGMLIHPATMLRREALVNIGAYRTEFEPAEDLDLWLRLAEKHKLANVSDALLQFRHHPDSVSRLKRDRQSSAARRAIEEACLRRGLPQSAVLLQRQLDGRDLLRDYFWGSWTAGNHRTSRKYARRMARQNPLSFESWKLMALAFCAGPAKQLFRWG
jgi:glycosyltransferase involved in cell wall biosynthesis